MRIKMLNSDQTWTKPIHVEIITMLMFHPSSAGALPLTGPAYDTALDDIREKYNATLTVNNNLLTDPRFATCTEWSIDTDRAIAEFYFRYEAKWNSADIVVFAGAHSDCNAKSLVYFATQLQKVVLSSVFAFGTSSDKTKWPTWISVSSDSRDILAQTHLSLLATFNWTTLSIVCDTSSASTFCFLAGDLYSQLSPRPNFRVNFQKVNVSADEFMDPLIKIASQSRVILYSGHSTPFRSFMLAARRLNMTNGEYVFITFWPFRSVSTGNYTWQFFDEFDQEAREAYRVMLGLGMDNGQFQNPAASGFQVGQKWQRIARKKYNYTYAKNDAMARAANAYTAFTILAEVLNEIVMKNETKLLTDGPALTRKFFNRTFQTEIGDMYVDCNGELQIPYIVSAFDQEGVYQPVMVRDPVTYQLELVKAVQWPNGIWPIQNRPQCGYDGKDQGCHVDGASRIITGIACSVCLATLGVFLAILGLIRQRSLEPHFGWLSFQLEAEDLRRRRASNWNVSTKFIMATGLGYNYFISY